MDCNENEDLRGVSELLCDRAVEQVCESSQVESSQVELISRRFEHVALD